MIRICITSAIVPPRMLNTGICSTFELAQLCSSPRVTTELVVALRRIAICYAWVSETVIGCHACTLNTEGRRASGVPSTNSELPASMTVHSNGPRTYALKTDKGCFHPYMAEPFRRFTSTATP